MQGQRTGDVRDAIAYTRATGPNFDRFRNAMSPNSVYNVGYTRKVLSWYMHKSSKV